MSRQPRPPPRGMSHADDSGSGVEDSLRRPSAFTHSAGPVFTRPPQTHTSNSAHAFTSTPDSIPSSSTLPPQVGWQPARASPQLGYSSARTPSFDGTPQAGPSTLFNAAPPRIERSQPRAAHMGPPLPSFAPSVGGGNNLFARPPQAMPAFGSPSEASQSSSFSFAPRALFAAPAMRPVRPTTATTAPATPSGGTNLDAAALAAERRIREARAATREQDSTRRRSVSFSPIVSTPQNGGTSYGVPPPIHRAAGAGPPSRPATGLDTSVSHLGGRTATHYPVETSLSTDTPFTRPPATRLFPTATTGGAAGTPSETHQSASWTVESSSHSDPPPPVRLRKWDGTATVVPSWLVSDSAETAVEEDLFDHDTIQRFNIPSLLPQYSLRTIGQGQSQGEEGEEGDVVNAILETQLGLRGLHGWYGHTYRNPPPASPSRKRRHSSSPSPHPLEEEPIVVYDSFGRIRGTITLPNYTHHGGPAFPLSSPAETFALRHAAAHHLVLTSGTSLAEKEGRLVTDEQVLKQRWRELAGDGGTVRSERFLAEFKAKRKARETFQAGQRKMLLKGLQNAMLDSTLVAPRRQVVAFDD